LWHSRKGPDYDDFFQAKKAITKDDKDKFSEADRDAWQELESAEQLILSSKSCSNTTAQPVLPVYVWRDGSGSVADTVAGIIAAGLSGILVSVADPAKAVLFIEVDERGAIDNKPSAETGHWNASLTVHVRSVWLGGRRLSFSNDITKIGTGYKEDAPIHAKERVAAEAAAQITNSLCKG
jgi:hypothetical protein